MTAQRSPAPAGESTGAGAGLSREFAIARAAGVIVVAGFASVAFVGWTLDSPPLESGALPGQGMMVLTALGLLALAGGVARLTYGRAGRLQRCQAVVAGAAVVAVGAAVLFEYVAGVNLGIDQALVTDTGTALSRSPGRPAPQTAVSLILLGAAIVGASCARGARPARWLALAACVVPVGALFGYLSGITSLFEIPNATGMAASTAISLLLVGLGVVLIDLDAAHLTALSEEGPRGEVLRRVLPAAVIMPTAVGVLIIRGERFGVWGTGGGLLLLVLASALVTVLGVLTIARRLKRLDDARKSVVSTLAEQDRRLATLVESAPIGIFQTDTEGRCTLVSPGWCAQAGMPPEDALGEVWTAPVHPADRQRVSDAWARATAGDDAFHESFRFRGPDGAATWLETRAAAMRDETGVVVGWVGTSTDISERVAIERQVAARGRITRAVADDLDPREIFALVAEEAARVLEGEVAAILRREGDALIVAGAWAVDGLAPPELGQSLLISGPNASAVAVAARTSRPAYLEYPVGLDPPRVDAGQPLVALAAPVRAGGTTWGSIGVSVGGSEPIRFEALATLEAFAEMVGLAVTSADARARLETMASTDHLTGLPNARTFHARLEQEVGRARRHNRPLSLVVLDLDHFKRINDAHGHQGGDRTLSEAATRMAQEARTSETIARVGGEEFAWILPDADGLGAYAAAERIRRAISRSPIAPAGTVTVSAGVCDLSDAADASELFRLADLALYWAKANGRDATFRYSPEVLEVLSADEQSERLARSRSMNGIRALARAVDAKDPSTGHHSARVAELASKLAGEMGWSPERAALMREAGLVHDVGKIGVPDLVLLKPGPLDPGEYSEIQAHAALGATIVAEVFTAEQAEWVRHHHERPDGTGYPDGLRLERMSEGCRILSLADAWDAMTSLRCHRAALPVDDALEELRRGSGSQFCPRTVAAFLRLWDEHEVVSTVEIPAA